MSYSYTLDNIPVFHKGTCTTSPGNYIITTPILLLAKCHDFTKGGWWEGGGGGVGDG